MKALQERFMQANINAVWNEDAFGNTDPFDPPPSVMQNPTNWVAISYGDNGLEITQEAKDVIDDSGLGASNFRIIYVPERIWAQVVVGVNTSKVGIAVGMALTATNFNRIADAPYVDTCFVSAQSNSIYTPVHEIVHLFLGAGHSTDKWNLMYQSTSTNGNYLGGTKRLTQKQVDDIRLDLRNKLK